MCLRVHVEYASTKIFFKRYLWMAVCNGDWVISGLCFFMKIYDGSESVLKYFNDA